MLRRLCLCERTGLRDRLFPDYVDWWTRNVTLLIGIRSSAGAASGQNTLRWARRLWTRQAWYLGYDGLTIHLTLHRGQSSVIFILSILDRTIGSICGSASSTTSLDAHTYLSVSMSRKSFPGWSSWRRGRSIRVLECSCSNVVNVKHVLVVFDLESRCNSSPLSKRRHSIVVLVSNMQSIKVKAYLFCLNRTRSLRVLLC
jgi:hypothetical protein